MIKRRDVYCMYFIRHAINNIMESTFLISYFIIGIWLSSIVAAGFFLLHSLDDNERARDNGWSKCAAQC